MKQKTIKKRINLDYRYKTNWNILIILMIIPSLSIFYYLNNNITYTYQAEASVEKDIKKGMEVMIITTSEYEKEKSKEDFKQAHLAKLRQCESKGDDGIIGDAGKSVGPYQWQKATLEEKLGRKVTNKEWLQLATDYEFIHKLTYKTYFEDGEWWRWYNCSIKLGYKKI